MEYHRLIMSKLGWYGGRFKREICGLVPLVGCVTGHQRGWVLELVEGCVDIIWHGNVHCSV